MAIYKHILLAVELIAKNDRKIVRRAIELAETCGAKLTVIHAIEHISSYGAAYGIAVGADIEEMLLNNAKIEMRKFNKRHKIDEKQSVIKFGPAKIVILEEAARLKADLVVVGSHGREGIKMLLGSTANAVLHGAKSDVLAVRV
jgi:universal stress protein A